MVSAFQRFLENRRGDLRRTAARTAGEMSVDDMTSESWLLAIEIGQSRGWDFDFRDQDDQDTLMAWLHNRFVKYAEKAVRYAVRLDRNWDNDDGEQTGAAIARLLTAPLDTDPQIRQQALEDQEDLIALIQRSYSEATAYVLLLVRVDWHLEDLAELLQIGRDALKRRLRVSGLLARVQPGLFDGIDKIDPSFEPRRKIGWARRAPRSLDLVSQAGLWA